MEIYLLRHAIAVDRGTAGYPNDDRPLTPDGIKKMKQEAAGIRRVVASFDTILTSPLKRAYETAAIVAGVYEKNTSVHVCDGLLPGATHDQLMKELSNYKKSRSVLLVGHEPDLSAFASALLGSARAVIEFKKGSLCRIDIAGSPLLKPGMLIWHLSPKQLRELAQ